MQSAVRKTLICSPLYVYPDMQSAVNSVIQSAYYAVGRSNHVFFTSRLSILYKKNSIFSWYSSIFSGLNILTIGFLPLCPRYIFCTDQRRISYYTMYNLQSNEVPMTREFKIKWDSENLILGSDGHTSQRHPYAWSTTRTVRTVDYIT